MVSLPWQDAPATGAPRGMHATHTPAEGLSPAADAANRAGHLPAAERGNRDAQQHQEPAAAPDWVNREGLTATQGSRRILITVSYDGTAYAGWQRQQNAMTVQQRIEDALTALTGHKTTLYGASRTDAGVHALGQCAHFDTRCRIPAERYPFALNTMLPPDIRVLAGRAVGETFHARFDAKGKQYTYRIHNARHASAILRNQTAHVPVPLDVPAMQAALPQLLGTHDFAAFQASGGTAKTTVRTLRALTLVAQGEELTLTVEGNAFLYNMVRVIAGTLMDIGKGKLNGDCFARALQTGNRLLLGTTAPACGLTLTRIDYDLPAR